MAEIEIEEDDDVETEEEADEELELDEPEEGDITSGDHINFYQYGKHWLTVPFKRKSTFVRGEQRTITTDEREDWKKAVIAQMDIDQFWPNVWIISDHGNCLLVNVYEE